MYVLKASGEKEEFQPQKIIKTLIRTGADRKLAEEIVSQIKKKVYNGISTKEILRLAIKLLKKSEQHHIAAKYGLREALLKLGPAGYFFEDYFAEVLTAHGYQTKLRQHIRGKCVTHEIDIVASQKDKNYMIECKYHNQQGIFTGIKETMYTWARWVDLNAYSKKFAQAWLATNTKFSTDSLKYARCQGMQLIGWGCPFVAIENLIESKKLYPITILQDVDEKVKAKFALADVMMVKDVLSYPAGKLKAKTGLTEKELTLVLGEINKILTT